MILRVWHAAQAVDSRKTAAYGYLLFSIALTFRILLSLTDLSDFEPAAFFSIGILTLSIGRLCGVRNPVPAPEMIIILAALVKNAFLSALKVPAVDEFLLAFDRNFGYAEMIAGRIFFAAPSVNRFFVMVYYGEMIAIPLAYTLLPFTVRKRYGGAVLLLGVLIAPMYRICPGAGPAYLLHHGFPWSAAEVCRLHPNLLAPHTRIIHAPLNTPPSGHVAWALLIFWFARKYAGKSVWMGAAAFLALMCMATLGTGEHYLIDLVLSLPFTACVWALVHGQPRAAVISMAVLVVWLIALREGWALLIPPLAAWILTAVTVACYKPILSGTKQS